MHEFLSTNKSAELFGEFTKYHGNGNDFIIFEVTNPVRLELLGPMAQKICDRHRGIGADGLIILWRERDWYMSLFNQDGSIAKNCGNGLRCVAHYIYKKTGQKENKITFSGREFMSISKEHVQSIDMGHAQVRKLSAIYLNDEKLRAEVAWASLGNEHLVFVFDQPIEPAILLPKIEKLFPEKEANIGFVFQKGPNHFYSEVYERGVGFTQSCGTGACAQAAFLAVLNRSADDETILIEQPGGEIVISKVRLVQEGDVYMFAITQTGKAQAVFTGYWPKKDELLGQKT